MQKDKIVEANEKHVSTERARNQEKVSPERTTENPSVVVDLNR
jgi:hypothetical protein